MGALMSEHPKRKGPGAEVRATSVTDTLRGAAGPTALASLAFFLLAAAILLTVIDLCCFDLSFFQREYAKDGTAAKIGMTDDDLLEATGVLLDYLKDERGDILITAEVKGQEREVFDSRETAHMVDVKELYQRALAARSVLLVGGAALLVACLIWTARRQRNPGLGVRRKVLRRGFAIGLAAMLAILAVVAILASRDFTSFWNGFHTLLFDNDLWLLDPRVSLMINMFPATFFNDLVMRVILWSSICFGAIALLLFFPRWNNKSCCAGLHDAEGHYID